MLTDDEVLARPDFVDVAAELARVDPRAWALHVRGPLATGRALHDRIRALVDTGAFPELVVNDRLDVALALGVSRVHLGQRSVSVATARTLLPDGSRIGVSVHSREEASAKHARNADYLMVGHVFPTASHRAAEPVGTGLVRALAAREVPVVGVGGISPDRVGVLLEAGAHGVAVLTGVWAAADPTAALEDYLRRITDFV